MSSIKQIITKLRENRINGFAVFDFVISYFAAYLLSFPLKNVITMKQLFYLVIPVSIIAHTLFRVHTPLTDKFWDPNSHYLIKITAIYMFIKGFNINLTSLPIISRISKLYNKK